MSITAQQLLQIFPNAGQRVGVFVPAINVAMGKYGIVTKLRIAAFLAQIGHESGQLRYVRELGSDAYLEKYARAGWRRTSGTRQKTMVMASCTGAGG